MAVVENQSIPPSLVNSFNELFAMTTHGKLGELVTRTKTLTGLGGHPPAMGNWPIFCQTAGQWLVSAWSQTMPSYDHSAFYAARVAELRASLFPTEYWSTATVIEDVTQYGTPLTVTPYTGYINPTYYAALRRPSGCLIKTVSATYPTPQDNGTPTNPAPGWSGTVIDTLWRDLYQTQRRVTLALPFTINENDRTPVAMQIDAIVTADSTARGHPWWFVINTRPFFWLSTYQINHPSNKMLRWLARDFMDPFDIPPVGGGAWHHERQVTVYRNAYSMSTKGRTYQFDRCTLDVQTPCSGGRNFARNDNVTVRHRENITLYVARKAHG